MGKVALHTAPTAHIFTCEASKTSPLVAFIILSISESPLHILPFSITSYRGDSFLIRASNGCSRMILTSQIYKHRYMSKRGNFHSRPRVFPPMHQHHLPIGYTRNTKTME